MKYEQHTAGKGGWSKWVFPDRKGYRMACCDCGLVHLMQFRMNGRHIEFRVRRFERATAGMRRPMKRSRAGHLIIQTRPVRKRKQA